MLSRKLVASFVNAKASSSRKIDDETKMPASFYSYRDFFGPMKEASEKSLEDARKAIASPNQLLGTNEKSLEDARKAVASPNQLLGTNEKNDEDEDSAIEDTSVKSLKLSKGIEDGLRHVIQVDQIKQRRDAARMKYQEILLNRSCSNSVSSVSSSRSTITAKSTSSKSNKSTRSKRSRVRKPKLLRIVSEIDEGDDALEIEAEAYIPSTVDSNNNMHRPLSPLSVDTARDSNCNIVHPFRSVDMKVDTSIQMLIPFSPMAVDTLPAQISRPFSPLSVDYSTSRPHTASRPNTANRPSTTSRPNTASRPSTASRPNTASSKRKPHVKQYASEYNMLVSTISKLFDSREGMDHANNPHDYGVIKFGSLIKLTHIDVGVGFQICVELRPGMMTYYKKDADGDRNVDVTSVPLKQGQCFCRPTKELKNAPFPMWNAVFEIGVKGRPTVFLMADSVANRQLWIDAFAKAVQLSKEIEHGPVENRQDTNADDKSQMRESAILGHNADVLLYLHVRGLIQGSCSKDEYIESLSILLEKTITIPVHWLGEYFEDAPKLADSQEDTPEEWERLANETLSVNGHIMRGTIEDTIGSIKSHLLDLDKGAGAQPRIKESQAIFFARDILLSCDRVKSEEQSIYCTSKMLKNDNLTFLTPSSEDIEPLKISLMRCKTGGARRDSAERNKSESRNMKVGGQSDLDNYAHTVEVTVRVPSIYRICSTDLLDKESWALMRTIHIQKFVLGPNGFRRMDRFVQFEIVPKFASAFQV